MSRLRILMDCERMKYPNTGLYHYCWQLGKALLKEMNPAKETLGFYINKNEEGVFGNDVKYFLQHPLHKFRLPDIKNMDVWHATYQGTMYYPLYKKIKTVLTVHDINFMHDNHKQQRKRTKYADQLKKKIENAAHIVFISRFVMDDVQQYVDLKQKPASIIYNGCNIDASATDVPRPSFVPANDFLFTLGTVIEKKNFHVLPCLLAGSNRQLLIAGNLDDKGYQQKIIAEAKKFGAEDRVIFLGPVSEQDKYWYLQRCEAFVFPSLAEGFGLPVIEAMYFGKPVFISSLTSLPEVGGNCAYYFDHFDPVYMQTELEKGLQHYNANPAFASHVKERAVSFNWQHAASQYLAVYRSL